MVTVAVLYDGAGFGAPEFLVTEGVSNNCTGWVFTVADLSQYGWNDVTSSFSGLSNCVVTLYENANFGGATAGPSGGQTSLGSMDNKASSVRVATS